MVLAGISFDYTKYRDDIHPIGRPVVCTDGEVFIFMDDNDRHYRARIVYDYLKSERIKRMDWPSLYSDLNPTEPN